MREIEKLENIGNDIENNPKKQKQVTEVKLEDLDHEQTINLMRQTKYLKGIFDENKWR